MLFFFFKKKKNDMISQSISFEIQQTDCFNFFFFCYKNIKSFFYICFYATFIFKAVFSRKKKDYQLIYPDFLLSASKILKRS
jgi:hypothetical protein